MTKPRCKTSRCFLLLIGLAIASVAAAADLAKVERVRRAPGNLNFTARWLDSDGLTLHLDGGNGTAVEVQLRRDDPTAVIQTEDRDKIHSAQFDIAGMPTDERDVDIVLKVRPAYWSIYADNRRIALLPVALPPPFTVLLPTRHLPEDKKEPYFQKTGRVEVHADFMNALIREWDIVDTGKFVGELVGINGESAILEGIDTAGQIKPKITSLSADDQACIAHYRRTKGTNLGPFGQVSGTWALRSVRDRVLAAGDDKRAEDYPPQEKLSANFYSLAGKGVNAMVIDGEGFHDDYAVSAAVEFVPGTESGLVFHYQGPDEYYAFTMSAPTRSSDETILTLWRRQGSDERRRLYSVAMDLTPNQWVMPRVEARQDRIVCYLDRVKIIDLPHVLPAGGRYGLFANAPTEVRFDDFEVHTLGDLDLRNARDIRFYTVLEHGEFFPQRRKNIEGPGELSPAISRNPQWLVLGGTADRPHVFSANFKSIMGVYSIGLLAGYTGGNAPHYRFTYEQAANAEIFGVYEVIDDVAKPLQVWQKPLKPIDENGKPPMVNLMVDASDGREVRFYRDGDLALVHQHDRRLDGASGVFVGSNTRTLISGMQYVFERQLYRNHFEKNRRFADDPYMRHWSSPEGDWIIDPKGNTAWHKSDFFGRFEVALPVVASGKLFMGILEDHEVGPLILELEGGNIRLTRPGDRELLDVELDAGKIDAVPLMPQKRKVQMPPLITMHYEGYTAWVTFNNTIVCRTQLDRPLKGRRMRLEGYANEDLTDSRVYRYRVTDYMFNRAPSDWLVNGGNWQVTNRFQCNPTWSHMNGQAADSFGAMWTKFRYGGDFCVEVYAGVREGFYSRCGDINISMLSNSASASRGYTVTCTGWDFDHSQLYSKLFRNGEEYARSEKYLVPRTRDGLRQLNPDPRIKHDRGVHGAWYYLKLRRIGNKLELWFDNELVFEQTDAEPLDEGMMGLWTFLNSIVVARVKIAAEDISPMPRSFRKYNAPTAPKSAGEAPYWKLKEGNHPAISMLPSHWTVKDPVAYGEIAWHTRKWDGPYFVFTNRLGAGAMHARPDLPLEPLAEFAGWSFLIKRTDDAEFNFHYSIGRRNAIGEFVPEKRFFHRISGTDFGKGPTTMYGETAVSGTKRRRSNWHERGRWTEAFAWLPIDEIRSSLDQENMMVRLDGFGNLQPSFVLQGLSGNQPGAAYAVAQLTPIRYRKPRLTEAESAADSSAARKISYILLRQAHGTTLARSSDISEINSAIDRLDSKGLTTAWLRTVSPGTAITTLRLSWIDEPEQMDIDCSWDKNVAGRIRIQHTPEYRNRRFNGMNVQANGVQLDLVPAGFGAYTAMLPRVDKLLADTGDVVVEISFLPSVLGGASQSDTTVLKWTDAETPTRPVLLGVKGLTELLETFESNAPKGTPQAQTRLIYGNSIQDTFIQCYNSNPDHRLAFDLAAPFSLARYPIMQFRYRADAMTNITLRLQEKSDIRLGEDNYENAVKVRYATPLDRSGHWKVWMGMAADGLRDRAYLKTHFFPEILRFRSMHQTNQTGRFSDWDIDDIVFGPAVASPAALAFTPQYFDFVGIDKVYVAVHPNKTPYDQLDDERRQTIEWSEITNYELHTPQFRHFNGIGHLLLKAVNVHGHQSSITDVPFILDNTPIISSKIKIEPSDHPADNGTVLRITLTTAGGAPLALENLRFRVDGKAIEIEPYLSEFIHQSNKEILQLNYPYILRRQLNQAAAGSTLTFTIDNIEDGAGNQTAARDYAIPINYANDKTGPAWLPAKIPDNMFWRCEWEGRGTLEPTFEGAKGNVIDMVHKLGEAPYLMTRSHGKNGHVWQALRWDVNAYPYLALRMRQPQLQEGGDFSVRLRLSTTGEHVVIPVSGNDGHPHVLKHDTSTQWTAGEWFSLIIDVAAAVRQAAGDKADYVRINQIEIHRNHENKNAELHLENLCVLADWPAKATIQLDAYDASGIGKLHWQFVTTSGKVVRQGESRKLTVQPAQLDLPRDIPGWLELRVHDRAGNSSSPLRVPLP